MKKWISGGLIGIFVSIIVAMAIVQGAWLAIKGKEFVPSVLLRVRERAQNIARSMSQYFKPIF